MYWTDLLLILVFAAILSSILAWTFGWRHPNRAEPVGASLLFLFLILFFAMWAGALWLPAWQTTFNATPWLGLLLIGLFITLVVLSVAAPPRRVPRTPAEAMEEMEDAAVATTAFGIFFWILLIGLVAAIVGSNFA